jgi:AcrR family transcriptional regulator
VIIDRTSLTSPGDTLDSRERVVTAARASFSEHGYEGASIADIAARAGVAEGTIYTHFSSKRELLEQVIRTFYEPLIDETAAMLAALSTTNERLRFLIRRQLQAFAQQPDLCRLLISEGRRLDGYYRSGLADLNRRYTALTVDVVKDGIRRGDLNDAISPGLVRDLVYGAIEHTAWKVANGIAEIDVDATADALTELVLHGIAARPSLEDRVTRLEDAIGVDR